MPVAAKETLRSGRGNKNGQIRAVINIDSFCDDGLMKEVLEG